jgi:hypothetical protein
MGTVSRIPVRFQDIPSSGLDRWYPLQKPDAKSKKPRGDVKIGLTLSTEKDRNLTAQEHRYLLKILFAHELQNSQVSGQFFRPISFFCRLF